LLYISNLHEAIKFSEVTLFADYTNLFQFGDSVKSLNDNINAEHLREWLNANKMALNASKTEIVLFKSRLKNFDSELMVFINGRRLVPSSSIKYLGVKINQHLTWGGHISDILVKLRRANGALSKLCHFLPPSVLLNLYHAIFNSHLRYACQLWGFLPPSVLLNLYHAIFNFHLRHACQLWGQYFSQYSHRIFILQKHAIRLISFSHCRSPSSPIFARFKILQVLILLKF